jgi:glycosyltransferase involved in cell wall biosynthesis
MRNVEPTVALIFGVQPLRVGGVERFTKELARQLETRGVRLVAVFSGLAQGDVATYLQAKNLTLISVPGLDEAQPPQALRAVFGIVRRLRPQVLHLHFVRFIGPLPWMARLCGVRQVLFTAHGSDSPGFVPRRAALHKRLAVRLINAPLDCVTCVSEYSLGALLARDLLPAGRFHRIYNGIEIPPMENTGDLGQRFRQRFGIRPDRTLITQVSWLIPEKGIADLLDAAYRVLAVHPQTHFAIVGDGPNRDEFQKKAAQLGIADSVTFTGMIEDPMGGGVYAACDIFCLASRWLEACPYVLTEAMAFEKPVVATAVGGVPELVEDGKTGLLSPAGDPESLAGHMIRLLEDPSLRLQMGRAGRKAAQEKFDLRESVAQFVSLYDL